MKQLVCYCPATDQIYLFTQDNLYKESFFVCSDTESFFWYYPNINFITLGDL